jgi:16S rRNA (cytosine967-C5)-methyltransferase
MATMPTDEPRGTAFALLRAVDEDGAYANLALPKLLATAGLTGRDAALATELGYGTLRSTGTLDTVLAACIDRPLRRVQPAVLDLLRLGAYQALRTRVPAHAAVASIVELARQTGNGRAAGFVNAVLRRVVAASWDEWTERLGSGRDPLQRLALRTAHPDWIAQAFFAALDRDLDQTAAALDADDERPQTHLVAWPDLADRAELGGHPGPWSPYAVRLPGGDPARIPAVREGRAAVQDEGSQLCAIALATAELDGRDERWLDLCAGPGGKTALLAALAAPRGASVVANELRPHRADLVRRATARWQVEVTVADGRELQPIDGGYDRVLVDAPCTGLGALRRRPDARWRRDPSDVPALALLQGQLLDAALRLVRPGGVVAYVTCSPHPAETIDVVAGRELVDARPAFAGVPDLGDGPTVQLWPHRHGTDAMFCALLDRTSTSI